MAHTGRLKRVFGKGMGDKLFLLLLFIFFIFPASIYSQCKFTIGHGDDVDTVCINDTVRILNYTGGPCGDSTLGDKHEWNYQSASMVNLPAIDSLAVARRNDHSYISIAQDTGHYFAFVTRSSPPAIRRYDFGDSVAMINPNDTGFFDLSAYTNLINGISVQFDTLTDKWYGFVTSGTSYLDDDTSKDKAKILRLTFDSGLYKYPTKVEDLGSYGGSFRKPTKIVLVSDKGQWYGFVANSISNFPIITKIFFSNGLGGDSASIIVDKYSLDRTLIGSSTNGITGLSVVRSQDGWQIFCVNIDNNYLIRADFDTNFISFSGTKVTDPNHTIRNPRDINIANDCNNYIGMVNNSYDQTFSIVHFDNGITGTIATNKSPKSTMLMNNLWGLSDVIRTQGSIYSFIVNKNGPITRIRYNQDTLSHTLPVKPYSKSFAPALFAFKDSGIYTVTLTVNGDYSRTTCRTVYVMRQPKTPIIDTLVYYCQGDTIALMNNDYKGKPDYTWTYPDLTVHVTESGIVNDTGLYKVAVSYDLCKSKEGTGVLTPYISPPPLTGVVPTVCPGKNAEITVTNIIPGDSIFAAFMNDSIFFRGKGSSFSYKFFTPIQDTAEGLYHYLLMRKPKNPGNCPKDTSKPFDLWFTVQRPWPPVIDKDTQGVCKPEDAVAVRAITGTYVRWYSDGGLTQPLTPANAHTPVYVPSPSEMTEFYNTFYATQYSGGCESHASSPAVVYVYVPGPPLISNINNCVDDNNKKDYFYAQGVNGSAVITWYADSLLSATKIIKNNSNTLLLEDDLGFDNTKVGTLSVWATQSVNSQAGPCTSPGRKATVTIGRTNPVMPIMTDPIYYTCTPIVSCLLRVQPDADYEKINWYLTDTTTGFIPAAKNKDSYTHTQASPKDYRYFIRQYKDGCWSRDTTILVRVVSCATTDTTLCNTVGVFDLYKAVPKYTERIYHWQDVDYTGNLDGSNLNLAGLEGETHFFQNKDQKVIMTVEKQLTAGDPVGGSNTVPACDDTVNLFTLISGYDIGGKWYKSDTLYIPNYIIKVLPNTNSYTYRILSKLDACPDDEVKIDLVADTTRTMDCMGISEVNIFLDEGQELYTVPDNGLDPLFTGTGCNNYTLVNNFNKKNTLNGAVLLTGNHFVRWTATNIFTKSPDTCLSKINVNPLNIPNMFTPNGDTYNDYWEFDLRKYPNSVVKVFNRWGVPVFELKTAEAFDNRIRWDGMVQGKNVSAPPDAYFYIIYDNDKIIYKGSITIVR